MRPSTPNKIGPLIANGILVCALIAGVPAIFGDERFEREKDGRTAAADSVGMGIVTLETLLKLREDDEVVLLDARGSSLYERLHIPGAKQLASENFDATFESMRELLYSGKRIVVYCSHRSCDDSTRIAARLVKAGISQVAIYPGGMQEWTESRLPTDGTDRLRPEEERAQSAAQ